MIWRGKNGVYKIGIYHSQSLVKSIIVGFYVSAKNSEHGDTKLVVSYSTDSIIAETFFKTKQVSQRFLIRKNIIFHAQFPSAHERKMV